MTLALGIVLGVAGASFAVALPLASYWYPPQHQGTALGIAGAGNSGTVLAALFAPSLAVAFGWRNVLGLAIIPLADRARAVRPARQGQPAQRRRGSRSRTMPRCCGVSRRLVADGLL